jgi:hypothetical protein
MQSLRTLTNLSHNEHGPRSFSNVNAECKTHLQNADLPHRTLWQRSLRHCKKSYEETNVDGN